MSFMEEEIQPNSTVKTVYDLTGGAGSVAEFVGLTKGPELTDL